MVCSLLAFAWPLAAQTLSPPSREVSPSTNDAGVVSDGIAIYRGQAYLLRNGRAAMINRALVPEGRYITWEGRLVTLPAGLSIYDSITAEKDGFMVFNNLAFWLHRGQATLLNNTVVPDGQVLTVDGRLVPLPSNFSGFVRDRTPAGSALPVSSDPGTEALPNQAGVPQILQGGYLQSPTATPPTAAKNSSDSSDLNQSYRLVGSVSPVSGIHTIPGTTAAHITNGATRPPNAVPPGSTKAMTAGSSRVR